MGVNKLRQFLTHRPKQELRHWRRQPVLCPICQKLKPPVQDHDHKNHMIRGKICGSCNLGLGHFRDDPTIVKRALDYLRYWMLKHEFDSNE